MVRQTYRDGGRVRHETLANLSALPVEAALKGTPLVPAGEAVTITGRCRTGTLLPCRRWP